MTVSSRLDRRGRGDMQAMALGWQQVVVDRLPHQVVPEPQPARGGPQDAVIDRLPQGVLDLGHPQAARPRRAGLR